MCGTHKKLKISEENIMDLQSTGQHIRQLTCRHSRVSSHY